MNTKTQTKLSFLFIAFLFTAVKAADVDLSLSIDFGGFNDGVFVGEVSTVSFTVSHLGPDVVDFGGVRFIGNYNFVTSEVNPFQFFSSLTSDDPDCIISQPSIDPRPPVNNYTNIYFGSINKALSPFSTVTCEYQFTSADAGLFDTLWQLTVNSGDTDPDLSNNAIQFTFGAQAISVPIQVSLILVMLMLLLTACFIPTKEPK